MLPLIIIPAYQAQGRVGAVVRGTLSLAQARNLALSILVVDDGSTDSTAQEAELGGAQVVRHGTNQGKGAAIQTGLSFAKANGFDDAVTADADGQHPPSEIVKIATLEPRRNTIVLGIRNLVRDGAPRANQFSNAISNYFLSRFLKQTVQDTQCGLRRYPVNPTLSLGCRDCGYAFEAEVLLRAVRSGMRLEPLDIDVIYPDKAERLSHFHVVRDPFRIIVRVLKTLFEVL